MLKLKEGFILYNIAGDDVVLPSGDELDLSLMIKLNGTGAFLWRYIEAGTPQEELVAKLQQEYEVDAATAEKAVAGFVERLRENGFLEQ